MKLSKLITLSFSCLLISCSKIDENTFSLVCVGTELIDKDFVKKSENKTYTFNFINKNIDDYSCHTWSVNEIICKHEKNIGDSYYWKTIYVNRNVGNIVQNNFESLSNSNKQTIRAELKVFNGDCEKVKEKKF
jgi:hypothetical protein